MNKKAISGHGLIYRTAKRVADKHGLWCSRPIPVLRPLYNRGGHVIENAVDRVAYKNIREVYFSRQITENASNFAQSVAYFDLRNPINKDFVMAVCEGAVDDIKELERINEMAAEN